MEERRIGISFSLKWSCVLIYQETMKALGYPEFFRFLINEDAHKLALEVCNYADDGFHIVPERKEGESYRIYSLGLLQMIWEMCGWKEGESFRAFGIPYPKQRIVEFDLNNAESIADVDFLDPKE